MNDPDTVPLKEMIKQALDSCADPDLLDLIYKVLTESVPEV